MRAGSKTQRQRHEIRKAAAFPDLLRVPSVCTDCFLVVLHLPLIVFCVFPSLPPHELAASAVFPAHGRRLQSTTRIYLLSISFLACMHGLSGAPTQNVLLSSFFFLLAFFHHPKHKKGGAKRRKKKEDKKFFPLSCFFVFKRQHHHCSVFQCLRGKRKEQKEKEDKKFFPLSCFFVFKRQHHHCSVSQCLRGKRKEQKEKKKHSSFFPPALICFSPFLFVFRHHLSLFIFVFPSVLSFRLVSILPTYLFICFFYSLFHRTISFASVHLFLLFSSLLLHLFFFFFSLFVLPCNLEFLACNLRVEIHRRRGARRRRGAGLRARCGGCPQHSATHGGVFFAAKRPLAPDKRAGGF